MAARLGSAEALVVRALGWATAVVESTTIPAAIAIVWMRHIFSRPPRRWRLVGRRLACRRRYVHRRQRGGISHLSGGGIMQAWNVALERDVVRAVRRTCETPADSATLRHQVARHVGRL